MPLVTIKPPPGVYRNGTELDASGRWLFSQLVRWHDDVLKPVGGWRQRTQLSFEFPIRGMISWQGNNRSRYLAFAHYKNVFVLFPNGDLYDITPTSNWVEGREDASGMTGYGSYFYGSGFFGVQPLSTSSTLLPATSIQFSTFGEHLVFCNRESGRLFYWDLNTNNVAQEVTGASDVSNGYTNDNVGSIVSDERFVFAFSSKQIKFSSQEQYLTNSDWLSSTTNQAGNINLKTNGEYILSKKIRGGVLIVTSTDAHATRYIGLPFVHSVERIGENCGAYGALSSASLNQGVCWWGSNGFFIYSGGKVQELKCDVIDYLQERLTTTQASKICAIPDTKFDEVTWYFPGLDSTENSEYVTWNYKTNTWYFGQLGRTSGVDRGVFEYPIKVSTKLNDSSYPLRIRSSRGAEPSETLWMEVMFNGQTPTASNSPAKDLNCCDVGNTILQYNQINSGAFGNPYLSVNQSPQNFLDTNSSINIGVQDYSLAVKYSGVGTLYETYDLSFPAYFYYEYQYSNSETLNVTVVGLDENGASQSASFQMVAPILTPRRLDNFLWTKITEINLSVHTSGYISGAFFSIGGAWSDYATGEIVTSIDGRKQIGGTGAFSKFIEVKCTGGTLEVGKGAVLFRDSNGQDLPNGANVNEVRYTQNKSFLHALPHQIYDHEVGFDRNGYSPYAETAPIQMGNGDNVFYVNEIIGDEKTQGDLHFRFYTRFYPNGAETDHGTIQGDLTNPTSVRYAGRQVRMRIFDSVFRDSDWRLGAIKLNVIQGGKR